MMLRMTAPRALMAVAVLLGLLSTCQRMFENTRAAVAVTTQNRQLPAVSSTLIEDVNLGPALSSTPVSSADTAPSRRG